VKALTFAAAGFILLFSLQPNRDPSPGMEKLSFNLLL
jgi:hypothetical protein